MKQLIAILALILLILPMVAGIQRMRRLPPPVREEDSNHPPRR